MTEAESGAHPVVQALHDRVLREEDGLVRLNARIARLALLLGTPLNTVQDVQRVLDQAPGNGQASESAQDRRLRHEAQELRGLMVLRCDLLTRWLGEYGLEVTYQMTARVEEQLEREGFRRGADGFELLHKLNEERNAAKR